MQNKKGPGYLTENEIKAQIKEKNFATCYCLFGDEHFLIKSYLDKIISGSVESYTEFNVSRFDGSAKIQSVYDAVTSFPMMSSKRVVSLCDYQFDKAPVAENEKLLKCIADLPQTTVFILWFETVEINAKKPGEKYSKLFKAIAEAGGEVCFLGRKSIADIMRMLQSGAARRKCRLEPTAARHMIEVCSDDLYTLINELEKLCMYVGENGIILNETIDKVCSRSAEASVYNISKAVLRRDLAGAYRILDDLMFMNTEPAYILTVLSSAYIDMYRCFAARMSGKGTADIAADFGYYNTAFRLADAQRDMNRFSEKQLVGFLKCLADADKTIKSSRCDGRVILEKTIAMLAVIAAEDRK